MKVVPAKISKTKPKDEVMYLQSNVMRLVLNVSKIFGVAPVRLKKTRDGTIVDMSPALYGFQIIAIFVISAVCVTCIVFARTTEKTASIRLRSSTMHVSWVTDMTVTIITATVGVLTGFARTKEIVKCMMLLQKINTSLNYKVPDARAEKKKIYIFLGILGHVCCLVISDYITNSYYNWKVYSDVTLMLACLYFFFSINHCILILLETQFIFSALEVYTSLKALNDALENILDPKTLTNSNGRTFKPVKKSIPELSEMYDVICSVIKKLDDANSTNLILLLIVYFTKLVITQYYIIRTYDLDIYPILKIYPILWTLTYLSCIVALVEPSHLTQTEMGRTGNLVSKLSTKFTDKYVSSELTKFSLYLQVNQVTYNPLGICTLSRNLVGTTMGMATTYIVILVQFRT